MSRNRLILLIILGIFFISGNFLWLLFVLPIWYGIYVLIIGIIFVILLIKTRLQMIEKDSYE